MDFKNKFKNIIKNNELTISDIAKALKFKSRNTLYRFMNGDYTKEKTIEILNQIKDNGTINISETDWIELYNSISEKEITQSESDARDILLSVYEKRPLPDCIYKTDQGDINISKVLKKHIQGDTKIYLSGIITQELVDNLNIYMASHKGSLEIYHLIRFKGSQCKIANELAAIIKLCKYKGYNPYTPLTNSFNGIAILTEKENKNHMSLIQQKRGRLEYIDTSLNRDLFNYFSNMYNDLISNGKKLLELQKRVLDLEKQVTELSVFERNDYISLDGMICFMNAPFSALYRMLEESNFLGASKESDLIQGLIQAAKKRCELSSQNLNVKKHILSERIMKNFFITHKTADHFESFGAFEKEEILEMLKVFLSSSNARQFRFFKDGLDIRHPYATSIKDFGIVIVDYDLKYSTEHFIIHITNEKAVKVFEDFTKWFWENYTINEDKGKEIMNDLINKYLE